ncbi:GNAT family N-acetyltransferase [Trinickia fusca]|uniref:N-acetyltransferase n=1 Tax=Trinickia fusca TaxID=2419777 RepID=A0A494XAQ7_9BURK|nr:GNAT family protein [Trinickia fusca]RKP47590.1 N-acetyltransferase [Trinickia fusca]
MITIRPLNAADAERFKALRLLATKTSPTAIWPTHEEENGRSIDEVAGRIASTDAQIVFGAFASDALVGITGLRRLPLMKVSHKATIWGVFVDPAHRGKGIAQNLLHAVAEHASEKWGCAQLQLCVNAENLAAKRLYASQGFVVFGVEPRALRVDGQFYDEEHMYKAL